MNMLKTNCHTHTSYCDGKNTAREMVEAAIEKGFTTIGFSGHVPMSTPGDWTMTDERLDMYFEELKALKKEFEGKIEILIGAEYDADYKIDKEYPFDYVISSVHQLHGKGKIYAVDLSAEELKRCADEVFDGSWQRLSDNYFENLAMLVTKIKTDIVGHYDLITKFNKNAELFDEKDLQYQKIALKWLDYIIDKNPSVVFEVNTGAMFRCGNETPYPAPFILKRIGERGAGVTISSDAHCIDALDYKFKEAKAYCKSCGIDFVLHLTADGFKKEKL